MIQGEKKALVHRILLAAACVFGFALSVCLVLYAYGIIGGGRSGVSSLSEGEGRFEKSLVKGEDLPKRFLTPYAVPADDLESLLRKDGQIETYYVVNTVTYFSSRGERSFTNRVWRDGESFRVQSYENGDLKKTVVCDGIYVTEIEGTTSCTFPAGEGFSAETYASFPRLDEWLSAADSSAVYTLSEGENGAAVCRITRSDAALGREETASVLLEYGLIYEAETVEDGRAVYRLTTQEVRGSLDGFNTGVLFVT